MTVTCIITTPKPYIYIPVDSCSSTCHHHYWYRVPYTPGSAPTYSPLSVLNLDLKPPELSYSLLPFFGDFYNLKIEVQRRS